MDKLYKILLSTIGGAIAAMTEKYGLILFFVIVVVVFDIITGMAKAKATGVKFDSKTGTKGFWKKISLLLGLFFGVFLDYFITEAMQVVDIVLPFASPFGLIVGVYIVLNESISICENLYACNPKSIPAWIAKLLKTTSDKIDNENKEEK
jgi:toxin secretion/phage lysis holin